MSALANGDLVFATYRGKTVRGVIIEGMIDDVPGLLLAMDDGPGGSHTGVIPIAADDAGGWRSLTTNLPVTITRMTDHE